ncbi:MAG: nucleotidyl transferase AbiEii/AbiGii toxin family protein [Gammaproteobacteria bacterium]
MIRVFRPLLEILPAAQRRLWSQLQPSLKLGLVLYGGTAIALRLGHRASVDYDFFTDKPLDKEALKTAFPFITGASVLQDQPDTFTVVVSEGVKLSFFGAIGFGRVGKPETTEDSVVRVAS